MCLCLRVSTGGDVLNQMTNVAGAQNGDTDEEEEREGSPFLPQRKTKSAHLSRGNSEDSLSSPSARIGGGVGGERGGSSSKRKPAIIGWGPYLSRSLKAVFLGSLLNVLLIFVPIAIVSVHVLHAPPVRRNHASCPFSARRLATYSRQAALALAMLLSPVQLG